MRGIFGRLRPWVSPGAAVSGGIATYFNWEEIVGFVFGQMPESPGVWFAQNIATLPDWVAALIVMLSLFAVFVLIEYHFAAAALEPRLQISIPHDSLETHTGFSEFVYAQWLFICARNIGTKRLTNIELYVYRIEPHQEIAANEYKYKISIPKEMNGHDSERVCLIKSEISDTFSALSSDEGPLLPKEREITLFLRATCAEAPATEFAVKQKSDGSGGVFLAEKKWWKI